MRKTDGLEIDQNLAFQRREWRVQRFGWWLLTAFVVAAALGLFGGGVLSRAEARSPDGALSIRYERFVRVGAVMRLTVEATGPDRREVVISREYFEGLRIDRITPEPASLEVGRDDVRLTFSGGAADGLTVIIDCEPLHFGRAHAAFRAGSAVARFTQLTYF
jgi:hypothetical protein